MKRFMSTTVPEIVLTDRSIYNRPLPSSASFSEWRDALKPLKEITTNPIEKMNIDRILYIIFIAESCGATQVFPIGRFEQRLFGKYEKVVELHVEFKTKDDERSFSKKLIKAF